VQFNRKTGNRFRKMDEKPWFSGTNMPWYFLFLFFNTFVGCEEAGTGAAWKRRCKAERPGDDGVLSAYGAQ